MHQLWMEDCFPVSCFTADGRRVFERAGCHLEHLSNLLHTSLGERYQQFFKMPSLTQETKYLLREPHILIGGLLIVTVAVQGLLGHLHHQAYKAETPLPKLTNAHRTLGRLLPLFCCVNALLQVHFCITSSR
jgi:hypothetical protein